MNISKREEKENINRMKSFEIKYQQKVYETGNLKKKKIKRKKSTKRKVKIKRQKDDIKKKTKRKDCQN